MAGAGMLSGAALAAITSAATHPRSIDRNVSRRSAQRATVTAATSITAPLPDAATPHAPVAVAA